MISLRRIALTSVTILLAVVAALTVVASHSLATIEINKLLDNELQQIALNAGQILSPKAHELIAKMESENRIALQVWTKDGEVIHRNPVAVDLPRQSQTGFSDVTIAGQSWRIFTVSDGERTAQAAQRWSARREIADKTTLAAVLPILAAFPIAWIGIIFGLDFLLKRISTFSRSLAARGVDAEDPIPPDGVLIEMKPVILAMNDLIDRHKQAVERQKRFLSEAAHELRTPLAALQIQIDNFRLGAKTDWRDADLAALGGGIRRATSLVVQLLRIARLEDQADHVDGYAIDLKELLLSTVSDFVQLASSRDIELEMDVDPRVATTIADPDARFLFGNLIDNAIRYSPCGSAVRVAVTASPQATFVDVIDTGTGIPADALPRIFDRFYRAAPADIEGSGLGLAIVRTVAERNNFEVLIANREDRQGVQARVIIPAQ